jgi:hypothetical protein
MALKTIADDDGDVVFNSEGAVDPAGDWCFESLGDPALDRILLRCHVMEMEVRQLAADVRRIKSTTEVARWLFWGLIVFVVVSTLIDFLSPRS